MGAVVPAGSFAALLGDLVRRFCSWSSAGGSFSWSGVVEVEQLRRLVEHLGWGWSDSTSPLMGRCATWCDASAPSVLRSESR